MGPDLTRVYEEHFSYVFRLLWRFGVPERDREDVAHDTFMVVQRKLSDFDRARPLRPWLAGIAFRVARAYSRRKMTSEVPSELPELEARDAGGEQRSIAAERQRTALRLLRALPLEQRTVFVLHELEGFTAPEISQSLSVPLNTVYSRLRIARRDIAALAQGKGEG